MEKNKMSEFIEEEGLDAAYKYTPTKAVLKGDFALSNYSVPYFQANLTLEEVHRHLKLVEDMPSDQRHKWSLEELFQRDINWPRVEEDIVVNYLKRKEKRSFFNALTVALLPVSATGKLESSYQDLAYDPPAEAPYNKENYEKVRVGGVQVAFQAKSTSNIQYLRWDEEKVFAATIDGQHRLAALKKFVETSSLTVAQRDTRIPVIFLVLDKRVGFDMPDVVGNTDDNPLLSVVREVFVDLNKHAKLVSNARQILLDDQDLESICTRNLLCKKTREESPLRLPLGLVNWNDDSVKFDTGSHFTSVSVLHLVIKDLLNIKYPEDPLDEDFVLKFINSVEDSLFLSSFIKNGEGEYADVYRGKLSLKDYCLPKVIEDEEPIKILPYEYSLAAVDSFNKNYRPLIYGVFAGFSPYRAFWDLSKEVGGVDGDLAFYNSLSPSAQKTLKTTSWSEDELKKKVELPEAQLNSFKSKKWAFMVVWQKAFLKSYCICISSAKGHFRRTARSRTIFRKVAYFCKPVRKARNI
ncbi:DGQHR domain-containing protein [Alteromonas sp. KUL49]|nr:DGQHR domain-containing protein [Alteromonas sp. KUL49]